MSRFQTKRGSREGHAARRMGLEAMPRDEPIQSRQSEREAGVEGCSDPVPNLLNMVV
jgi:hypothetical protein